MSGPTAGIPKTAEHRAAMSRGMRGKKKVGWTEERKQARRQLIANKRIVAQRDIQSTPAA